MSLLKSAAVKFVKQMVRHPAERKNSESYCALELKFSVKTKTQQPDSNSESRLKPQHEVQVKYWHSSTLWQKDLSNLTFDVKVGSNFNLYKIGKAGRAGFRFVSSSRSPL